MKALERLDPPSDELFPAEQARIVQLLVERVDVSPAFLLRQANKVEVFSRFNP